MRSDTDWSTLQERAKHQLNTVLARVLSELSETMPVFFLAFLEPATQINGILGRNRQNTLYALVRGLNDYLEDRLTGVQNAHYLEVNDLRQYYGDATAYDGYVSHFTHGGVLSSRQGHLIHLGILERVQAALRVLRGEHPVKLIITDLDNTIWKGVLAEADEIIPLEVTEGWPLGYVEALLACKQRGILLAICSKNDETVTRRNFEKVWGNRLQMEDFCSVQINWQPKSANIARILAETNILPEHTLFIDDSPLEISEVTRAYSQIRTLTGEPERWRHLLLYAPETQVLRVTEESVHRTELIQAKVARDQSALMQDRETWLQGS
ncbi:HAD-IIIC family phosphatase [Acidithiobacillus sp.]|uniref:HAD-IIIC family phosphatase n=1 Tax=Acidithiobacillus sp. TaxID=1872118 RepID=UPI0023226E79|nr:HAD-IIIC family phosphatase [Acidithiobacillus sp.]MDA8246715.1 HAD-IIIC family phosphatase [Acidithiobacillus sp.]